ncbi:MAG TPA: biopolymer transporter ExbD, partial [Bacteroidales bacterium]|nr:biopolymer transporter ExbD [Bacteroidales bacterium]
MAKFIKTGGKSVKALNTSSLPDIVFMILFFFMAVTTMRETDVMVTVRIPEATEGKILEKKSLASFIYIGEPLEAFQGMYGTEPKIQLNDTFKELADIQDFIAQEREQLNEADKTKMLVVLKIDRDTRMGVVTDVKQALRRASA